MTDKNQKNQPKNESAPSKKLRGAKFCGVFVVENYEHNGEKRSRWHEVGRAWVREDQSGTEYMSIELVPGISVSGRLNIRPATPKENS